MSVQDASVSHATTFLTTLTGNAMGKTTELRRELKKRFHPLLRERGFTLDAGDGPNFQTFRSIVDGEVFIVEIQWEKYGRPRFVLNFGRSPASEIVIDGTTVTPGQLSTPLCREHGRLHPGPASTTRGWFCQDRHFLLRLIGMPPRPAAEVVDELLGIFPELDSYWRTGVSTRHLHRYGPIRQGTTVSGTG